MMKARYYKLTDHKGRTHNGTQWGPGIRHEATGKGTGLCSDGWIHCYPDKYLAVLRNPCDAQFKNPQCWLFEPEGESLIEPLKCGFKAGTTVERVPLPRFTTNQRIVFGILCAKASPDWQGKAAWNTWAEKWLSGKDRTASYVYGYASYAPAAAYAAAYAAASYAPAAAYAASYAAASYAAAYAADAASYAADAAYASYAADAAYAAASAADAASDLDFPALARQAYQWKDKGE